MLAIVFILLAMTAIFFICASCTVNILNTQQKFEEARERKLSYRTNEEFVGRNN